MGTPLRGKNILITGASSGIGRALALELARRGNLVVVAARTSASLDMLADAVPGRIVPLVWDVSDVAQSRLMSSHLFELVDRLDVVILNAGTCEYIDDGQLDFALIERVMAVNFIGMVNSLMATLPLLRCSKGRPYVVGVSSMSTYVPFSRAEAYGASKAALRYFLESLRVDLSRENFDISIVSPGFVKTALTERNNFPMPFIIDVDLAVRRFISGMERRRLHIAFPRRLDWSLRLLRLLPEALMFKVLKKLA